MNIKHLISIPPITLQADIYRFIARYIGLYIIFLSLTLLICSVSTTSILIITALTLLVIGHCGWLITNLVRYNHQQQTLLNICQHALPPEEKLLLIINRNEEIVFLPHHRAFELNHTPQKLYNLVECGILTQEHYTTLTTAITRNKGAHIHCQLASEKAQPVPCHITPLTVEVRQYDSYRLSVSEVEDEPNYFILTTAKEDTTPMAEFLEQHVGVLTLSEDGNIVHQANSYTTNILGYSYRKLSNIALSKLLSKNDLEILQNTPLSTPFNMHIKTQEGERLLILCHTVMTQTTPERKALIFTEIPLQASSTLLPSDPLKSVEYIILESSLPTLLLDKQGKIVLTNDALKKLSGNEIPISFFDISNQDDIGEYFQTVPQMDANKFKPLEIQNAFNKDMMASAYISPMYNSTQQHIGYVCHMVDTTEFKNLELRFVHSQKMQAIGQLAGGIAHDFNNLLTAMIGFCDLLLVRHPSGDASFANIMQIKQNANRAANLVRQLLAFSRKQTLQPEIINITEALADLSNLIDRLIGDNILLDIVYGKGDNYIKFDQGQLEQIVINLAVNARDAMPDGGKLTISSKAVTIGPDHKFKHKLIAATEEDLNIDEGEYIVIKIADTGTGIESDVLNNIFEPFFSTKEVGSGTGLGLSTVYGIIKQTDGYIYVSSKMNKGTKFYIYLKRYRPKEEELYVPKEEPQYRDLTGSGTVLLVEDEAPVRMFSKNALGNKGYTIIEADCGESALEQVKKHNGEIDIIVTDVLMPGMNGPTMVKKVHENYPDIKVIFTSGYAEDAFVDSIDESQFHFLPKPYSLKQLAGKVKTLIQS